MNVINSSHDRRCDISKTFTLAEGDNDYYHQVYLHAGYTVAGEAVFEIHVHDIGYFLENQAEIEIAAVDFIKESVQHFLAVEQAGSDA